MYQELLSKHEFSKLRVKGPLPANRLPKLEQRKSGTYYFRDNNRQRVNVEEFDGYIFHGECFMVKNNKWVNIKDCFDLYIDSYGHYDFKEGK